MTGWELFYESLRYYPSRPDSAMCKDFMDTIDVLVRAHISPKIEVEYPQ